ncbi:MAG: WD40 repeat domain-containing protein [Blastocatellia bacterium]
MLIGVTMWRLREENATDDASRPRMLTQKKGSGAGPKTAMIAERIGADAAIAEGHMVRLSVEVPRNPDTPLRRMEGHREWIESLVFSPDGKCLASGSDDESVRIWDVATGRVLQVLKHSVPAGTPGHRYVWQVSFTPDGQRLISNYNGQTLIWDLTNGKVISRLKGILTTRNESLAVSADGQRIAASGFDRVIVWNAAGDIARTIPITDGSAVSVALTADGKQLITGHGYGNNDIRVWDAASGKLLRHLRGHRGGVWRLRLDADNRLFSVSDDGSIRVWDLQAATDDLAEVCVMAAFHDGVWAVVGRDGRFDTNSLEQIRYLHWLNPDDALQTLPLEIFMRDYYEPRLLPRLLAGEQLPPVKNISDRNRIRPRVSIMDVKPEANADQVSVTIEVINASETIVRDGTPRTIESGASNLRLFRDGQLVGYAPHEDGAIRFDTNGKTLVTFEHIRLPHAEGRAAVLFEAYAFNSERVKSESGYRRYKFPQPLAPRKGRAYIISLGVNAYDNPAFDLKFAANDARRLQAVIGETLRPSGQFADIVTTVARRAAGSRICPVVSKTSRVVCSSFHSHAKGSARAIAASASSRAFSYASRRCSITASDRPADSAPRSYSWLIAP